MVCPNCFSTRLRKHGKNKCGKEIKQQYVCKKCRRYTFYPLDDADVDLIKSNVKLSKQKQSYQDLNRIERKSFREFARI